jgi:bifunctional non-homologous end joining protein LigD
MEAGTFPTLYVLQEYVRKRDFRQTPEPAPGEIVPAGTHSGRFFIQRHNATRLHYDFRLEIDGTLKSWAIPKGPSLDPAMKHLAAMVEDHPLDYGDFEGNIPKGQYGGGSVMLWDRGTFEVIGEETALEQIARGDLKFRLHGEKLSGTWALVRMKNRGKGNEWLIIKKKDEAARPGGISKTSPSASRPAARRKRSPPICLRTKEKALKKKR